MLKFPLYGSFSITSDTLEGLCTGLFVHIYIYLQDDRINNTSGTRMVFMDYFLTMNTSWAMTTSRGGVVVLK